MAHEDLSGKVALVTGASRGIGRAVARALGHAGAEVACVARDLPALSALAEEIEGSGGRAWALDVDLMDRTSIERLQDHFGERYPHLDILINNAGWLPAATRVEQATVEEWDSALAINLTAPWLLSRWAVRQMRPGSAIVNILSGAAFYPSIGLASYNVSKAALAMLTRCTALEFAARNVRVVGVIPGKVDTEMVRPIVAWFEQRGERINPMGRIASADEIAEVVVFLVSDRAAFVTGALVPVDGGELTTTPRVV